MQEHIWVCLFACEGVICLEQKKGKKWSDFKIEYFFITTKQCHKYLLGFIQNYIVLALPNKSNALASLYKCFVCTLCVNVKMSFFVRILGRKTYKTKNILTVRINYFTHLFDRSQAFTFLVPTYQAVLDYILIENLRCTGEETSLNQCSHTGVNTSAQCLYAVYSSCNSGKKL